MIFTVDQPLFVAIDGSSAQPVDWTQSQRRPRRPRRPGKVHQQQHRTHSRRGVTLFPSSTSSCSERTALSKRRSAVRVRSGSLTSVILAQVTLGPKGRSNTRINWPTYLCHGELVLGKVYSCGGRHQRRGLGGGEVVGKFLGFPGHGKGRIGGFPQLTLQNRWTRASWSGVVTGQQRIVGCGNP